MISSGVTRIIDDIELVNAPNSGYGVSQIDCGPQDYIYSFYNPAYDWNCDKKYTFLIGDKNVKMLSDKITELLDGVHPEGLKIKVPYETIRHVVSTKFKLFQSYDPVKINEEVVSFIVGYIRAEFQAIKTNQNYSVWNTLLSEEFNDHGLRAVPSIKIKRRYPNQISAGGIY